jgi:hypothetical protein
MDENKPNEQPLQTTSAEATSPPVVPKKPKSKKFLIGGLVAVLLLGGGAFAYQSVVLNSPENIWKTSMQNTAKGLKAFNAVDKLASGGANFKGSFNLDKPTGASASFEGKTKDLSSSVSGSVSAVGSKVDFNLNTIKAEGSEYPDVYFKVKGLASVPQVAQIGPGLLTQVEDKWFFADHTLLAQGAQQALQATDVPKAANVTMNEQDIKNIREKFADVMAQYVFTTDEAKSIVKRTGEPVSEDFEGRASVKYVVEPQKENMKAFLTAMKQAVKDTKLKDLIEANGSTVDDSLKLDDIFKTIESMKPEEYRAEVWADKSLKYVRNIRFTDDNNDSDGKGVINIGLNYTGGDDFPFYLKADGTDSDNTQIKFSLSDTINRASGKMTVAFDADMGGASGVKANMKLETEPSKDDVKPEKPSGARNIMELFSQFTGGSSSSLTQQEQSLLDDFQSN